MNNYKIIDEFYNITMNNAYATNKNTINNYKILCRKDIGLKTKKTKETNVQTQPVVANIPAPNNTQIAPEINYSTQPEPVMEATENIQTPPRPQTVARPSQARPGAVRPATRPVTRPVTRPSSSGEQKK